MDVQLRRYEELQDGSLRLVRNSSKFNLGYIDAIVSRMSDQRYETLLMCKADILKIIEHFRHDYTLRSKNMSTFDSTLLNKYRKTKQSIDCFTQRAEWLTTSIYSRIENYDKIPKNIFGHVRFTRLIRKVKVEDDVSIDLNLKRSLPWYVFPLGRLCQIISNTKDKPAELEEIVLVDILSPKKALWIYRFLSLSKPRCCSLPICRKR